MCNQVSSPSVVKFMADHTAYASLGIILPEIRAYGNPHKLLVAEISTIIFPRNSI